ncbi:MAG: ABC transporter permease [Verrucomicrobia bacterium]|nr:ABC transporter permease [Verrucomicrobiota bacterium]
MNERPHRLEALRDRWPVGAAALRAARRALVTNPLRTGLTLLAVTVGMFSIILAATAIRAIEEDVARQSTQFSAQTFAVYHRPEQLPADLRKGRRGFDYALIGDLLGKLRACRSAGAEATLSAGEIQSRWSRSSGNAELFGVTPGVFPCRTLEVAAGRALTAADLDANAAVCVLGAGLAQKLFPSGSALDERVNLDGWRLTVVGVLEAKGAMFGQSQDNVLLIPLTTGLRRYGGRINVSVLVEAPDARSFDAAVEEARGWLRTSRGLRPGEPDDFEIWSNAALRAKFAQLDRQIRAGGLGVSLVALLAAAAGVMNVMLAAVAQRTREIGVRLAVGARPRDILFQFLAEAVALCAAGGLLGILLGVGGGNLGAMLFEVRPVLPLAAVVAGLAGCVIVGIAAGIYPALRASRLDPIESLRAQ